MRSSPETCPSCKALKGAMDGLLYLGDLVPFPDYVMETQVYLSQLHGGHLMFSHPDNPHVAALSASDGEEAKAMNDPMGDPTDIPECIPELVDGQYQGCGACLPCRDQADAEREYAEERGERGEFENHMI